MKVILVHGIFDTDKIFKPMRRILEADGHECYAPSLKPSDARLGIIDLAEKLKEDIDQKLGTQQPIAIIGFSMGCLVSRHYIQQLGGYKRTKAFFAISGPHNGTMTAYCYIGKGARDMRPNSPFLTGLLNSEDKLSGIALYAYRTPFDAMIIPSRSSDWNIAKNKQVNALIHSLMLKDKSVRADILSNLNKINQS